MSNFTALVSPIEGALEFVQNTPRHQFINTKEIYFTPEGTSGVGLGGQRQDQVSL